MRVVSVIAILLLAMASLCFATEQNAPPANPPAEEGAGTQQKSSPGDIPTLSEWGMIIFGVALAGWMARMIMRRRQKSTVGF